MKLFIWRRIGLEYIPGIAFAVAETKDQAVAMLLDLAEADRIGYYAMVNDNLTERFERGLDAMGWHEKRWESIDQEIADERDQMGRYLAECEDEGGFSVHEGPFATFTDGGD